MNIHQAISSGKRFRRRGADGWYSVDGNSLILDKEGQISHVLASVELCKATDFETEPKSVLVSARDLKDAIKQVWAGKGGKPLSPKEILDGLIEQLDMDKEDVTHEGF